MLSRRPACIGAVCSRSRTAAAVWSSPYLQTQSRCSPISAILDSSHCSIVIDQGRHCTSIPWETRFVGRWSSGDHAEERIRERGWGRATLAVEDLNIDAMRLYRRRGYVVCGAEDSEWDQQAPDGTTYRYRCRCLLMQRALKPA